MSAEPMCPKAPVMVMVIVVYGSRVTHCYCIEIAQRKFSRLLKMTVVRATEIFSVAESLNRGGRVTEFCLTATVRFDNFIIQGALRSEERRVGKESRSRWSP